MPSSSRGVRIRVALTGTLALANSACGGGSGGGSDAIQSDFAAPLAVVQFPPDDCLTDADRATVTLAVTDDSGIASVRVEGQAALREANGLWRVSLALPEGVNVFHVATQDTLGNSDPSAAQVTIRREGGLWIEPSAVAFDGLRGEALVLDPASRALFAVDPASGRRTLRSGPSAGAGPSLDQAHDVALAPSRNAALVTEGQARAVVLVDLDTGERAILSSPGVGSGPAPIDPQGIAVEERRNRALVLDPASAALLTVDLASGARTTLSSDAVGGGPSLGGARRLSLDLARDRALVILGASAGIAAVDLVSGARTLFSGGPAGSGVELREPVDVEVDPFLDRALVVDRAAQALLEVALATGERRLLSSSERGLGPAWLGPAAVTRQLGNAPLVIDAAGDALLEVAATSGDRRILTRVTQGAGPQLTEPAGLGPEFATPGALVVAEPGALFSVALASGARALVSGAGRGLGAAFRRLADVAAFTESLPVGCERSRVLVALDAELPGLWTIDPHSGDRYLLSGPDGGSGPSFVRPRRLVPDLVSRPDLCMGSLLVLDESANGSGAALLRVDLSTGARVILSDATHGSGPEWVDPVAITSGPDGPFVLDAGLQAVLAVDPESGERSVALIFANAFSSAVDLLFEPPGGLVALTREPPALWTPDLRIAGPVPVLEPLVGPGPTLGRPEALEVRSSETLENVPALPIAFVLDSARAAVLAVDLATGERFLRTK